MQSQRAELRVFDSIRRASSLIGSFAGFLGFRVWGMFTFLLFLKGRGGGVGRVLCLALMIRLRVFLLGFSFFLHFVRAEADDAGECLTPQACARALLIRSILRGLGFRV